MTAIYCADDRYTDYFNSHAHVERDHRYARCCLILVDFNSHAHVERDCCLAVAFRKADISTHTLTWSVTIGFYSYGICRCISTHTLTWSVTMFVGDMVCIKKISTHTLTWSVTNLSCCFLRAFAISTHTLTWSVTL